MEPMPVIWKYCITTPKTAFEIPKGAVFLSTRIQRNVICLWFLLDSMQETEFRTFRVYGTGESCRGLRADYLGTVQESNGLVWHIFEET
jgi:hypothetical protein